VQPYGWGCRMRVVMVVKSNVTDSGLKNSWDTDPE
jgi:hypothetical protein